MQSDIALIGLAVMGQNLVLNMESRGNTVSVFNRTTHVTDDFVKAHPGKKLVPCHTLEDLVKSLKGPRKVMLMVKAGPAVDDLINQLIPLLSPGDVIIDGGNTLYNDTQRRTKEIEAKGLLFIGTGVSGGEEGALKGPSMMPGGSEKAWPLVKPIFQAIAAKVGPNNDIPCCEWVGPDGAGHYVKMVHNGIEYGLMAAYAEGLNILRNANVGKPEPSAGPGSKLEHDAETTPLRDPEFYQFEMNLPEIAEVWRRGSVIGSWLLDLTAQALQKDAQLGRYAGRVSDSGEGRWTLQAAIDEGVPVPALSAALFERFSSRGGADFANRVLSAMREEFGGHAEKSAT